MAARISGSVVSVRPMEATTHLLNAVKKFYGEQKMVDVQLNFRGSTIISCHKIVFVRI